MSHITVAVPDIAEQVQAARRCIMALEPDSGVRPDDYGPPELACRPVQIPDADGNLIDGPCAAYPHWMVYGAPVEAWVAESAQFWKLAPDQFRAVVIQYNNVRFPDEPDPSLTTVRKFTDNVQISTAEGTAAGLAALGLEPLPDAS